MKNHQLRIFACAAALIAVFAVGFVSCEEDDEDALKGIEFEEEEIVMTVGEEYDLSEILLAIPVDGELPKCTYTTDDKTVATVGKSTGKVKAVAEGEAVITATTSDGTHSAECIITVTSDAPSSSGYTVSGSLEYSATASWTSVSASFDDGDSYAATASIANSRFSLAMPTPKTSILELVTEALPSGITVDPQSAQGVFASFFARKGTQSVEIIHAGLSGTNIVSLVTYTYVDKNVNIKGTYTYSNGGRDVYDLQLKKGWNAIINTWDYTNNKEDDFYATGSIPSSSAWVSEDDISSSPAQVSAYKANEKPATMGFMKVDKKMLMHTAIHKGI